MPLSAISAALNIFGELIPKRSQTNGLNEGKANFDKIKAPGNWGFSFYYFDRGQGVLAALT